MRRKPVVVGALLAIVVIAGAAWLVIAGRDRAAPSAPGDVVTADTVRQVLLNGAELTALLNQPFRKTMGPTRYGGPEAMGEPSTTGDCVGVVDLAARGVYASADVRSFARQTWSEAVPGDKGFKPLGAVLMFADEAVVALPSAAAARDTFARFAEQWRRCDDQAVNQHSSEPGDPPPLPGSEMHIRDVRVGDDLLAASVVLDQKPEAPDTRALGVRGNCIVEVLLPFTGATNVPGSAVPETSSSTVARAIMDKISKHS